MRNRRQRDEPYRLPLCCASLTQAEGSRSMTDAEAPKLSLLAKLGIAFILMLVVAGIVWHGVSIATFKRIWHQLIERTDAPMRFRFILQPLMAAIAAILDGLKDAR